MTRVVDDHKENVSYRNSCLPDDDAVVHVTPPSAAHTYCGQAVACRTENAVGDGHAHQSHSCGQKTFRHAEKTHNKNDSD